MPKLTYTTPPPSLMTELHEVANDARALAAELAKANQLPSDFPVEQLQELLVELQTLPDGTAEGSRQPLEYARSRLPAIRRTFIQTEEQSRRPRPNQDIPPPLTRGMVIDQRIGALVNSVTTALDEYRALASVELDDSADTAPSLEIDAAAPDAVQAMMASAEAEKNLSKGAEQVEEIAEATSTTADNLKRQMRDARGLLRLARVELRMPGFVPRWYRNTIDTVKNYPKLLRNTAKAIQVGIDVARPMAEAWSHFTHGYKQLILDSIEKAAKGLDAVGKKWEREAQQPAATVISESDGAPPDFDLEKVHEMILSGQAPPARWRPWIMDLDFFTKPLRNLGPLSELIFLQDLDLDATQVVNLAPLSGLRALQTLWLNDTKVRNLEPLGHLTRLQRLYLDRTPVSDLTVLAQLTVLEELWLDNTEVRDLTPLANLTALGELWLGNTLVRDLGPLTKLVELKVLYIDGTPVNDLTPLKGLFSLEMLALDRTQVTTLAPLAELRNLEDVSVENKRRRNALAKTLPGRGSIVTVSSQDRLKLRMPRR